MIPFTPPQDFTAALEQARRDIAIWNGAIGDDADQKVAEWAGQHRKALLLERETTIRFLQSPDRDLRLAATALVALYWLPDERFAAHTVRLAFRDPDAAIRGAALVALRMLRHLVSDPADFLGRLLGDIFPAPSMQAVEERKRKFAEHSAYAQQAFRKMWEEGAGSHVDAMLESRDATEAFLTHAEPQVRCAAILALKHHWQPDDKFPRLCERLLLEDPDLEVRGLALSGLAGCHALTDHKRVGELVAQLVLSDSEPDTLRAAAYRSLLMIRGMPVGMYVQAVSPDFRFPADVNWDLVKSFVNEP